MGYLALLVLAVFGHAASAKSWGGYDYHRPMRNHHFPTGNHHNFNYNTWCHSAGGWDGNQSWEDSNESPEEYGDKKRPLRAGDWDRSDSWEDSSSEEEWDDYKKRLIRAGGWDSSESLEDSSSEESQEWNDGKNRLVIRSTTTRRSVVINKTQTDGTSSVSIRLSSTGSTPSPLEVLLCLRMCPVSSEYNPVCGTDNITYWNPGRIQCAISCGINVAIKRQSPCPSTNLDATEPTSSSTTLSPVVLATCMRSCSVTSEYNPVCGTDNITYNNPSRLECAKGCGKPVSVLLPSRCPPPDQLTSTTTTSTTTPASITSSSTTSMTPTSPSVRPTRPNPGPTTTAGPTTRATIAQNILDAIFNGSTTESVPDFSLDERYE